MKTLDNKTVLLTGASRGIGASIARQLSRARATVVGIARSREPLEEIRTELRTVARRGEIFVFDLRHTDQLPALLEEIHHLVGSVDILINNAGIGQYGSFQTYSREEITSILDTNLVAAMELTRLVLTEMLQARSGHVVNIASLAGKKGTPYDSVYSASKAGLIMWTDALRQELRGTGVNISLISPGYVRAGTFADPETPLPRFTKACPPDRVAAAVLRAIQTNKAEIIINGGLAPFLFAVAHFCPRLSDAVYRWLGITALNRARGRSR